MSDKPGTFEYESDFARDCTVESMAAEQRACNVLTAGTHVAVPRELLEELVRWLENIRDDNKRDGKDDGCPICETLTANIADARAILDDPPPDDSDEMIEPKPRATGILNVTLKYGGRGKPVPYPLPPWEERDEP